MNELSVGLWLRHERERRGVTLKHIADQTKVAVPLLEGLEAGDLSRWPGGIYRRAFVKSYAAALGLDTEGVLQRFEAEHPAETDEPIPPAALPAAVAHASGPAVMVARSAPSAPRMAGQRARLLGTAADLTVALVLSLGSAAAGSRLLWPVLFIALYYAIGILLTGTSPMVALLSDLRDEVQPPVGEPAPSDEARAAQRPVPPATERRSPTRRVSRAQRASKTTTRPRVQ
jgi:transcriptional regulator with XRE-family HTH domain